MIHRNAVLLLPFVLVIGAAESALAADWPTFHAENGRNPRTAESLNATHLVEAWRFTATQPPAPAWPAPARWDAFSLVKNMRSMRNYDAAFHVIAVADRVYFGSSADDSVYCLDAVTGKIKWTYTTDGPVRAAPTFHDGKLYFGSDDGHAYCLDAARGTLIWRTQAAPQFKPIFNDGRAISLWPVRTGVLIENNIAYFGGSLLPWEESYLCAADAMTGKLGDLGDGEKSAAGRYRRALGKNLTLEGTLLSANDQLIAPQGRVAPLLFSKLTGEPRGSLEGGGGCFVVVTPDSILHGPGNKEGWITESNPQSRKKIASFNAGSAIIVDGDVSYLLATDQTLTAVDRKQRSQLWQSSCAGTLAMILAGNHLFIGGEDKVLAYDRATGDLLWTAPVTGRAISLAVASGALFVSTDEGVIHCLRPGEKPAPGAVDVKKQRAIEESFKPPVLPIAPVKDDALIGRWIFQRDQVKDATIKEITTGNIGKIAGKTRLVAGGELPAMRFDGAGEIIITEGNKPARLPEKEFTAEAWVNVEQPMEWGGILSYMQDNGDYEQGWILGYQKDKFSLGVAAKTKNKLTYMPGKTSFNPRGWHHVVGTYDGSVMRLYVDGKLDAESKEQSGPIAYPPNGWHVIASYHDKDENYKMKGAIHEVRLYMRVLTAEEIAANYKLKAGLFPTLPEPPPAPPKAMIAMGPWLEFTGPSEAVVRWHTSKPCASRLVIRSGDAPPREHIDAAAKTEHEVVLKDLRRDRADLYTIHTLIDGIAGVSEFDCDTHMNYTQPAIAESATGLRGDVAIAERAGRVIKSTEIDRGIALVIGLGDGGKLAWELARQSGLRVIAFDTDRAKVGAARAALLEAGGYGQRVAALHVDKYDSLPLREGGANLIIINGAVIDDAALKPYLRPDGGTLWRDGREPIRRGPLDGTGSWTHMYGSANNAGFAGETLAGATATTQLEAQWVGRPGPRGNPDRQPRKPAPLAAAGRLFIQGHQRVTALDAYNGTILWHWEIPPMIRFNVPRDASNWCADERHVFIAIDDRVWKLDAGTGRILSRAEALTESTPLKHADWGYVARVNDLLIGSAVPRGSNYTNLFGGDAWYDEPGGPKAAKSCSDSLFALDAATGIKRWVHAGLIINPTITIEDGRATFLESRSAKLKAAAERHISRDELWKDLHLVTLDLSTGQVLWEKKIDIQPGSASIQLASSQGRLVLMASHAKKYHLYTFAAKDGAPLWNANAPWFDGKDDNPHHGTHMSRPVIVDQKLYIRPWIFDVATGQRDATRRMPVIKEGHGCGTYCATQNVLIFRSGDISVWDQNAGTKTSWNRLRPDCWLSTIPALGMVLSPEGGGGCSCGSWMETSIGFMPVPVKERTTRPVEKVEPGAAPIQR